MNVSELCVRRPVMTTLLMAAIVVFGTLAYFRLPVSELPAVDFPTISVTATLPGASPETMAAAVATPLESEFSRIAGLASMNSTSASGATSITLTFSLDRPIDAAAADVQAAMAAAARRLPIEMTIPPSFRKVNPADAPIFYVALSSRTLPISVVDDYAETQLAQRLSTVGGVAQVQVFGSAKFAVRAQVDPDKLAARGIGIDEVQAALAAGNVNKPTGVLDGTDQALSVRADGQLDRAAAYRPLAVVWRNGAPVRLEDVALVRDSVENSKVAAWFDGQRAVVLAIQRQPGSNTIETVQAIKKQLPAFQARLPAGLDMKVMYDRTESIREGVDDVKSTLALAGGLVVLVIFLFLRNASATIIPAVALPISVVGTFAVMFALGHSIDNLSLLALTLAVGFVVDDAIVMLENIVRHLEAGDAPLDAALKGSREIGFTILSMTVSLIAVFIPVMFMGGIVGRLLHEFAVTICAAIAVSGVVSITLTPLLCSRFLKPGAGHGAGAAGPARRSGWRRANPATWLLDGFEWGFARLTRGYERTLDLALRHRAIVLALFVATVAATAWLYGQVSKDFLPSGDTGQLIAFTEGAQDASFEAVSRHQREVAERFAADPDVESVNSTVGAGGPRATSNTGTMFLKLKPREHRGSTPDQVIQRLRAQAAGVVGIRVVLQNPPPIRIGGQLTQAQYQYTLQGSDPAELADAARRMAERLRATAGLLDVSSNLYDRSPTLALKVDRDRIAQMGLTYAQVEDALQSAFSTRQVSTIYGNLAQYQVILEVDPSRIDDPAVLTRLYVRAASGRLVPLDTVASVERRAQPLTVNHQGQLQSVTLSFNLAPGTSLGDAVDRIHAIEADLRLPVTIGGSFQGTAQAFQASLQGMGWLLLIAVVTIYLVLGILYESFVHPLTILSGLPAAGLGALLTLLLFRIDLSLYAFVGIVMLIGIVKKNAIMMIDFALERQRGAGEGGRPVPAAQAIREACLVRFRPIMMTTLAALAGTLPIAIGAGAGGETRAPLGMAVVGGLVVSQVLTLYLTPVVYLALERLRARRRPGPDAAVRPAPGSLPRPARP